MEDEMIYKNITRNCLLDISTWYNPSPQQFSTST